MIKFAKVKETAIIPTKRDEDAGYDLYACLESKRDKFIIINPHKTRMVPLGVASVFDEHFVATLKERGSTGSKGLANRCGVIDSGFRGEWNCVITNTHDDTSIVIYDDKAINLDSAKDRISELSTVDNYIYIPTSKAITQVVFTVLATDKAEEIDYESLLNYDSERGSGMLGSSNK